MTFYLGEDGDPEEGRFDFMEPIQYKDDKMVPNIVEDMVSTTRMCYEDSPYDITLNIDRDLLHIYLDKRIEAGDKISMKMKNKIKNYSCGGQLVNEIIGTFDYYKFEEKCAKEGIYKKVKKFL